MPQALKEAVRDMEREIQRMRLPGKQGEPPPRAASHQGAHRPQLNTPPIRAHSCSLHSLHSGSTPLLPAADSIECLKGRAAAVAYLPQNCHNAI